MAKPILNVAWTSPKPSSFGAQKYTCGFCDLVVGADLGFLSNAGLHIRISICPHCNRPTYFENQNQYPGVAFGGNVEKLPADVGSLYDEARVCCSSSAFTGAVLLLRKLLMNIAVNKGAPEGQKFIEYVEYLSVKGYVPPDGKGWVDHIRKKGNEATHEIKLMAKTDAEDLITFSQMLLKFIYEFPSFIPPAAKP